MNKKLLLALGIIAILLSGLVAGCSPPEAITSTVTTTSTATVTETVKPLVLIAQSHAGTTHGWNAGFHVPWLDEVERRSEGKVQFQRFWSGELAGQLQEIDALEQGNFDILLPLITVWDPGRFPLSELPWLPVTNVDVQGATRAYKKLCDSTVALQDGKSYYELEFTDENLRCFASPCIGPYTLATAGKEISKPEDFGGLIVRAAARCQRLCLESMGATPVLIGSQELYDALARGTADGVLFSIADWTSWNLHDGVLQWAIDGAAFGYCQGALGMTEETWQSIPADIQKIMEDTASDLLLSPGCDEWDTRDGIARAGFLDNGGEFVEYNDLDPAVKQVMEDAMAQTWLDWIDAVTADGAPGLEAAKLWRDLIMEEGGDVPEVIRNL